MTRIVSGAAGSTRLDVPRRGTRPTSDRVREGLFSALTARVDLNGLAVLDLYAGSGALGLEAVSRGATTSTLVDNSTHAITAAKRNARAVTKALGGGSGATIDVVRSGALEFLRGTEKTYDVVFADPPYDLGNDDLATVLAALTGRVADDALVIVERDRRSGPVPWPDTLREVKASRYGETTLAWATPA